MNNVVGTPQWCSFCLERHSPLSNGPNGQKYREYLKGSCCMRGLPWFGHHHWWQVDYLPEVII